MYLYFLVLCVALVILSPLAAELFLTALHARAERREMRQHMKQKSPGIAWAPVR